MEQSRNPGMGAPELWVTTLTDQQRDARNALIGSWMQQKQSAIREDVQELIHSPNLVDVPHREIGNFDTVRATYHPHSVEGIPNGPDTGDAGAAGRIINQGKDSIDNVRDNAEIQRASAVRGSADVQADVNADHEIGFFQDPRLRR